MGIILCSVSASKAHCVLSLLQDLLLNICSLPKSEFSGLARERHSVQWFRAQAAWTQTAHLEV